MSLGWNGQALLLILITLLYMLFDLLSHCVVTHYFLFRLYFVSFFHLCLAIALDIWIRPQPSPLCFTCSNVLARYCLGWTFGHNCTFQGPFGRT